MDGAGSNRQIMTISDDFKSAVLFVYRLHLALAGQHESAMATDIRKVSDRPTIWKRLSLHDRDSITKFSLMLEIVENEIAGDKP